MLRATMRPGGVAEVINSAWLFHYFCAAAGRRAGTSSLSHPCCNVDWFPARLTKAAPIGYWNGQRICPPYLLWPAFRDRDGRP
jgi:hypothetical protein